MTRSGIVLSGIVVLDIVNIIDRWQAEEQISYITETIRAPGGPPHNAAAGLVKLGATFPVTMIGVIGDDAFGDTVIAKARSYGLDTSHLHRMKNAGTSYTQVMTSAATGRRTFFVDAGVNAKMTADQLLPSDDTAKIFYIGSPGFSPLIDNHDGWRETLGTARTRGFKTAMELCPIPAGQQKKNVTPCLPLLDYFVINDTEAEHVCGITVTSQGNLDWAAAESACRQLLDMGVNELVAIHHPQGAVAMRKSGETARAPSVNVPREEIIGSVGAGDAFYAGMLFGIHEDWPLDQCLALANASAATSLHSPITSASIRSWRECLDYAKVKGLRVQIV